MSSWFQFLKLSLSLQKGIWKYDPSWRTVTEMHGVQQTHEVNLKPVKLTLMHKVNDSWSE